MEDRLVSKRTILQILVLLALGVGSGAIYNGLRSEGGVELGVQGRIERRIPDDALQTAGGHDAPEQGRGGVLGHEPIDPGDGFGISGVLLAEVLLPLQDQEADLGALLEALVGEHRLDGRRDGGQVLVVGRDGDGGGS